MPVVRLLGLAVLLGLVLLLLVLSGRSNSVDLRFIRVRQRGELLIGSLQSSLDVSNFFSSSIGLLIGSSGSTGDSSSEFRGKVSFLPVLPGGLRQRLRTRISTGPRFSSARLWIP